MLLVVGAAASVVGGAVVLPVGLADFYACLVVLAEVKFFRLCSIITLIPLHQLPTLICFISSMVLFSLRCAAAPVLVLRGLQAGILVMTMRVLRRGVAAHGSLTLRRPFTLHRIARGDIRCAGCGWLLRACGCAGLPGLLGWVYFVIYWFWNSLLVAHYLLVESVFEINCSQAIELHYRKDSNYL